MLTWGKSRRDERGAAVVETALCICFVVLPLVFGIIAYAYMLSFRQTVTQAAAEGARAAVVAPSGSTTADRRTVAISAVSAALSTGAGGLTCSSQYVTCTAEPVANCADGSANDCFKVTVSYPYRDHSLLPTMPGLGFSLPQTITYSAMAEVG